MNVVSKTWKKRRWELLNEKKQTNQGEKESKKTLGSEPVTPDGGAMRNYLLAIQNAHSAEWHYLEFAKVHPEQREEYLDLAERARNIRKSLVNSIDWESTREWCALKHWLECDENGGEAMEKCYEEEMDIEKAMDALKKVNEMIKIQAERMLPNGGE